VPPVVRIVSRGPDVNNSLHKPPERRTHLRRRRLGFHYGLIMELVEGRRSLSVSRQRASAERGDQTAARTVVSGWVLAF
jgi:hypothetical protein